MHLHAAPFYFLGLFPAFHRPFFPPFSSLFPPDAHSLAAQCVSTCR